MPVTGMRRINSRRSTKHTKCWGIKRKEKNTMSLARAGKITGRTSPGMISTGTNGNSRADRTNTRVTTRIYSEEEVFPISSPIYLAGWAAVEKKHRSVDRSEERRVGK